MAGAPSFVNGQALYAKYNRPGRQVLLTTTSTISRPGRGRPADTGLGEPGHAPIRLLTVSRIDPRKGLRYLPAALADLVGARPRRAPDDGRPDRRDDGRGGARPGAGSARELGVADRIEFVGARTLPQVLALAREHDLFVLPTLPGEGVPRVLLEAMASGLPIVGLGRGRRPDAGAARGERAAGAARRPAGHRRRPSTD